MAPGLAPRRGRGCRAHRRRAPRHRRARLARRSGGVAGLGTRRGRRGRRRDRRVRARRAASDRTARLHHPAVRYADAAAHPGRHRDQHRARPGGGARIEAPALPRLGRHDPRGGARGPPRGRGDRPALEPPLERRASAVPELDPGVLRGRRHDDRTCRWDLRELGMAAAATRDADARARSRCRHRGRCDRGHGSACVPGLVGDRRDHARRSRERGAAAPRPRLGRDPRGRRDDHRPAGPARPEPRPRGRVCRRRGRRDRHRRRVRRGADRGGRLRGRDGLGDRPARRRLPSGGRGHRRRGARSEPHLRPDRQGRRVLPRVPHHRRDPRRTVARFPQGAALLPIARGAAAPSASVPSFASEADR